MTTARGEVARAGLIGAATGLRSTWGLAALSWAPDAVRPGIASRLSRPWVRITVLAGAAGEFIADKSSSTPDRLSPAGLVPRLLLGALTGAAVSGHRNSGALPVAGGVAAAAMPDTGCSPRRVRFTSPDISWADPLRHLIWGRSGPWGVCIGVGMRKSRAREGRW